MRIPTILVFLWLSVVRAETDTETEADTHPITNNNTSDSHTIIDTITEQSSLSPASLSSPSLSLSSSSLFASPSITHNEQTPVEIDLLDQVPIESPIDLIKSASIDNSSLFNDAIDNETRAQFLSFEDWKKLKGVDTTKDSHQQENLPNRDKSHLLKDGAFGEEMEIDLSNFFQPSQPNNDQEPEGKLYKDKFNFASFDCGATIVKTNSEAKSATSILFENKDSYLLNPCSAQNKFVTIELCQDILVDSVVIGNFEFFSSTFKKISISVSDIFPVPKNGWKNLGVFTAKDIRDFQTFNIDNPMIWAKYFRVEILEHYGNEYYCPLSIIRVHGRTMMQEYKQEEAEKVNKQIEEKIQSQVKESCTPGSSNNSNSSIKCPPTHQQNNNSTITGKIIGQIDDLNLSNGSFKDELQAECAVSLPLLKFEEFFTDYNKNQSKCEPSEFSSSQSLQSSSQQQQSTGTQESIYKNIMKRLSLLEANATLSVLYIEEQSKLLSQAFETLEKRQSSKLDNIISSFNSTIRYQIQGLNDLFLEFYEQTETVLASQRATHEELLKDSYKKINSLSTEMKYQKILGFINGVILLSILIYVILTRDASIDMDYVESKNKFMSATSSKIKANITSLKIITNYNSDRSYTNSDNDNDNDNYNEIENENENYDTNPSSPSGLIHSGNGYNNTGESSSITKRDL